MKQTYFAIEGIPVSGKTMAMGWLGDLLETDGYKFNLVPKPVNEFKWWKTYDPLVECYQNCNQSAAMAHMHIMNTSLRYYSQNILMARCMDSDLIVSDRSILSPPVFADVYFRHSTFSAFTKDSLCITWEEQMRDQYEIQNVKPDVIIYLDTPTDLAYRRLVNDESQQHCKSKTNFLRETMLIHMDSAYEYFLQKTDIPHHTIRVTNKMTRQDVGNEVYSLIRQEMCAEGGSDQLYSCVLPCCKKL